MKCDEAQNRLDEYVDGTLAYSESIEVAKHAERCAECSALVLSMTKLQHEVELLPKEITPGRDLWPAIANEIGTDQPRARIVRHNFKEVNPETLGSRSQHAGSRGWNLGFAAAAILIIVAGSFWFATRSSGPAWNVEKLEGLPEVDHELVSQSGQLHIGDWLVTDGNSKARLSVGMIGEIEVEPNTRLRLVQANVTDHRVSLQRGTIRARIWAPPRLFFVETPSALAIDLGCAYTLTVDQSGAGFLHVTGGYVALEFDGHESLIPEGAMCATRPGRGPGTPFLEDASQLMRTALTQYDFDNGGTVALKSVLAESRKADVLTLWHLLRSAEDSDRELVYDKLAAIAPPPDDVNREGILHGDRVMLERWGKDLGVSVI